MWTVARELIAPERLGNFGFQYTPQRRTLTSRHRAMSRLLAILFLGLMVGCSSVPGGRIMHSLYTREVVLSRQHPQDDLLKAKLVAIAEDGTTTIQCIETGDTLRAVPGEFFSPGPYGTQGLQLISASADKHEAHLLRTWCETK
jgi:hypothetical protein